MPDDPTTPETLASTRRIRAAAQLLTGPVNDVVRVFDRLDEAELSHVADVVRQHQIQRASAKGDHDAIIKNAFELGFGANGLPLLPWVEGAVIVCPGGMVAKSKSSHRCRFVSVDDVWIWDSAELLREDKRSNPGSGVGFKAVGLLPLVSGLALDVVSGRSRSGQHAVEHVISYEVRRGELVEVSQRKVLNRH